MSFRLRSVTGASRARRIAVAISTAAVLASGIVFASSGLAYAASSCTNISGWTLSPPVGDGVTAAPSIGASTDQFNCDLWYGTSNPGVAQLQWALDACYGQGLATDGIYGPLTRAAVENVQSRLRISVDGVYGPQTRTAMTWPATEGGGCSHLRQPVP